MIEDIVVSRLIEARKDMGVSQKQVELDTGISSIKLAKIEVKKQRPDIETIYELSKYYEVPIEWIFGTGERQKKEKD